MVFRLIINALLFFSILSLPLSEILAQPGNDDPCGAIVLSVENGSACLPSDIYSWTNATATPGFPAPDCASYETGDIWFTFTISDASDIYISTLAGTGNNAITDGGMELYYNDQGCTDTFFKLICDDDAGPGSMPKIQLLAQAPGTYYIRFWDYKDHTSGDIGGICVAASPVATNTVNDDPCTAMEVEILDFEICNPVIPISWSDATATAGIELPSCGSLRTGDIWFSFTLTDTLDLYISTAAGVDPGAVTDGAMALYTANACDDTLVEIACQDNQGEDMMPKFIQQAALPGNYFIRFWDRDNKISGNIGGLCIAGQPSVIYPILNDEPCGAKVLSVSNDTTCIPDIPQFWSNATASQGFLDPFCGSYSTGDIWYKFTLTEVSDVFITTLEGNGIGVGIIDDGAMALYEADSCDGAFLFIVCDDDAGPGSMPQIKEYGLPKGDYYIRFWDYRDKVSGNIGGICVAAVPSVSMVQNDNCFSAESFPDIPNDGSCSSVSVNTEGATGNQEDLCDGITDDDVWYSFIVPVGISQMSFQITTNGEPSAQIMRIYRGDCDQHITIGCINSSEGILDDLLAGQIYFIQTFTAGIDTSAQYAICLRALIPPVNDDPCGAITIIPSNTTSDCVPDNPIAWQFATPSDIPDPGCGNFEKGDVWFKFELTFKADIVIKTAAGTGNGAIIDGALALYKQVNDCNELEKIECNDDEKPGETMPAIRDYAFSPGIYYIRFWDYYGAISGNIGGICLTATPTISTLVNDQCDGAIPFPQVPTDESCAVVHVNTTDATGPTSPALGFSDDDLWYSFTVPQGVSTLLYEITTNFGNTQHGICLFDACGFNNSLACFAQESGRFDHLVEGETYFIEVYTLDLNVASDFNVCLKTPPPPPSNDECLGAIAFPTLLSDGSCATVSVNTTWATSSGIFSCEGEQNDVWYSFVVPDGVTDLIVDINSIGRGHNEGFQLFSGDCDDLTSVYCLTDRLFESTHLYNMVPGQSYLLRVFTTDTRLFEFDLCLRASPAHPSNDLCPDAIAFPDLPTDGSCATVIADTRNATGDNSEACSFIYDDDVWYSFVVPVGFTGVTVMTTPITGAFSSSVSIYGGDCDHLEFLGCYDNRTTVINGLAGGQTYYARASTTFTNEEATFEICLAVIPPPPVNDDCTGAIAFPDIPQNGDWVYVEGSNISGTSSGLSACNGADNNDVWLSFVVPAGQDRLLFSYGSDLSLVLELYNGECDQLQFIDCYGTSNPSTAFYNLIPEGKYYLRVYNAAAYDYSSFKIGISSPQHYMNDFCEDALEFPPIPLDGSCVALSANTAFATASGVKGCTVIPNNDVWFKFTVPDNFTSVILDMQSEINNMYLQVFGGSCDNLVEIECFHFPYVDDISGLEPGETYWIQAFPIIGFSAFSLCLSVPPPPPSNDDCVDAFSITSSPGIFHDPGSQTTAGARNSGEPLCYPSNASDPETYDVWYSFVTDMDGGDASITINFEDSLGGDYNFLNFHLQAFEGDCGNFTTLSCHRNEIGVSGYDDAFITTQLQGLTANTKYYFRVFPTTGTHNYAPINFTVFAEGTALSLPTAVDEDIRVAPGLNITSMYPSPAHDVVNIEYSADIQGKAVLSVTDLPGRVVQEKSLLAKQGDNREKLFLNKLLPGMYFLSIENNRGRSLIKKFVVE